MAVRDDLMAVVDELQLSMAGWDEMKREGHSESTAHGTVNFLARDRDGNLATALRLYDRHHVGAG